MSFLQTTLEAYRGSKESVSQRADLEHLYIQDSIKNIKAIVMKNAKKNIDEVRLQSYVHPKVLNYFKEEGFIVWHNNLVTVIRIPHEDN